MVAPYSGACELVRGLDCRFWRAVQPEHRCLRGVSTRGTGQPGADTKQTLFEENTLKKRVLVSQHQALVSSAAVGGLQTGEVGFMGANGVLELFDVLGSTLAESRLSLAVSLLALLRRCVDLEGRQ